MTVIPEYMKLRQYLINLTLKDDSSKPIASERELAERFGVTRRTIRRALDDMVRDNYLIRRPRSGYYVSERAWFPHLRQRKTIGVFIVDGMNAFYGSDVQRVLAALFEETERFPVNIQMLTSSDPALVERDMRNLNLDGLLWFYPPAKLMNVFEEASGGTFPVVGLFALEPPECGNWIAFDPEEEGRRKAQYLIDRGCRNLIYPAWRTDVTAGVQRALKDAGLSLNPSLGLKKGGTGAQLKRILKNENADGACVQYMETEELRDALAEAGVAVPERFQYVAEYLDYDWTPTITVRPYRRAVSLMLNRLWDLMHGGSGCMRKTVSEWTIRPGMSTKEE